METGRQEQRVSELRPWAAPLLRWAGSKRKLLPLLMKSVPVDALRYIEPFVGSACLFFALRPASAVLGDINSSLLETYEVLRDHPRQLARLVLSMPPTQRYYYRLRNKRPESLPPLERAARFVYLNRFCFNGVYRTNREGLFNVPRGQKTGGIPSERDFVRCSIALRTAVVRPGDFENCLSDVRKGDFVYLDPPYAHETRRPTGEYGYGCFAKNDHDRLLECLRRVERAGAIFLLSYSDNPSFARAIKGEWHQKQVSVRRHVAGFADHRSRVNELLVTNMPCAVGGKA
jgi:DNA adenine methylase